MLQSVHPLRVAAAQISSHLGEVEANVEDHLRMIEEARSEGVQVLLFPEMSLTGHSAGPRSQELSLHRRSDVVRQLAQAAGSMTTVFGAIEEGPGGQFYNSAFAVQNGKVLFVHRKVSLATYGRLDDGKHFASGRQVNAFGIDTEDGAAPGFPWRAGLLICNDLWNPALVHLSALHGATLLLSPVSSAVEAVGAEFDNPAGWAVNLRFYAITYGMPVIMANRCGAEGDLNFWGGSRVLDPFGRIVAEATDASAQLVIADLDYSRVRSARYLLPTLRDSNVDLLVRESRRLAESLENSETSWREL